MKVREVMHPGGALVAPETPLAQIATLAHEAGVVPIGEFDRLVGIVTEREISQYAAGDMPKLTARDVMAKPIVYCYPEEELDDALRIMHKHAVRRLPVVSHQKRMVGILTLSDIAGKTRH